MDMGGVWYVSDSETRISFEIAVLRGMLGFLPIDEDVTARESDLTGHLDFSAAAETIRAGVSGFGGTGGGSDDLASSFGFLFVSGRDADDDLRRARCLCRLLDLVLDAPAVTCAASSAIKSWKGFNAGSSPLSSARCFSARRSKRLLSFSASASFFISFRRCSLSITALNPVESRLSARSFMRFDLLPDSVSVAVACLREGARLLSVTPSAIIEYGSVDLMMGRGDMISIMLMRYDRASGCLIIDPRPVSGRGRDIVDSGLSKFMFKPLRTFLLSLLSIPGSPLPGARRGIAGELMARSSSSRTSPG